MKESADEDMRVSAVILTAFLAAGSFSGRAWAADILQPAGPPASSPVYVWSGPYAGAFVGYNFTHFDQSVGSGFDGEGFVGGIYTGYNVQAGAFVYGLEGDIGLSGVDAGGFNGALGAPIDADGNVFGSLRARVGVAYDPFLLFATGGLAVADKTVNVLGVEDENIHIGYELGAGVEAKVGGNVTSRIEYRYSDFNSQNYDFGNATVSTGFDEHSIRAGLALKF